MKGEQVYDVMFKENLANFGSKKKIKKNFRILHVI